MGENFDAFLWIAPVKSNPLSETFDRTEIVWNYPANITPLLNSYQNITSFCFPDLEMMRLEKPTRFTNEFFIFTLTNDSGNRIFGICLRTLDGGIGQKYNANRRPRHCLCFVTKNPYFIMFKFALEEVHSLALLNQSKTAASNATIHFLSAFYAHKLLSKAGNFVIPPNPRCAWYNPLILVPSSNASAGKEIHSLAPLMEVLGVEKFFLILSAILCEERILFIADDIDTVSTAVHAVSTMLSPFQWQHLFLPILPSSLIAYTSSPFPFIIGIRRYQFNDQVKRALSDVVVVDADTGECTLLGEIEIKNFIAGEPIAPLPTAATNLTETGMGIMRAGMQMLRTSGINLDMTGVTSPPLTPASNQSNNPNTPTENVVQSLLNDIRVVIAKDPSKSYSARLGRSAADNSRDKWIAELDKTIRQSLLMFYVYLFGDINNDLNPGAAHATLNDSAQGADSNRGVAKNGDSFGSGDSRAAFKLKDFINRRRQLGASPSLIAFLEKFFHSQMFERFCAEQILAYMNRASIRKPTTPVSVGQTRGSITQSQQQQQQQPKSTTMTQKIEINSEYEKTCTELTIQRLSSTIVNIKYVIDEMTRRQTTRRGVTNDNPENEFHPLALQITSNSLATVTISLTASKVDPNTLLREQFHQISQDALTDNIQCDKVMKVVWLRLDDCKGFNWKHGLRGLQLLLFLLLNGPAVVLTDALAHLPLLIVLKHYSSEFSTVCPTESRDLIKKTARQVIKLLFDISLLALQRRWIVIYRMGGLQFNKLNQQILIQRREDCKRMNIAPFNPQSINQIPSFKNIHEVYRPPANLRIPPAPKLLTAEERHKYDRPTLLVEGDDDTDIAVTIPITTSSSSSTVAGVGAGTFKETGQQQLSPPSLPQLGFDTFFTATGELKIDPSAVGSSSKDITNQGFENFDSHPSPTSDPFFGGSSESKGGNDDPFNSDFVSRNQNVRPSSYSHTTPTSSAASQSFDRPASLPTPLNKSFDPFSEPFTSSSTGSKPSEGKSASTFDMFDDPPPASSSSQVSKTSDPFSDPFGGFSQSTQAGITTGGLAAKSTVDPFNDPFISGTATSFSDPFTDPFAVPAPVQKTSSQDPFALPFANSVPTSTSSSTSTSKDPFASSFATQSHSFPPSTATPLQSFDAFAPVTSIPTATSVASQPDIFGGGVLTPATNNPAPASRNTYHDPFADLLSPNSNSQSSSGAAMMPYVGLGTYPQQQPPPSSSYQTTSFDYSMLQSQQTNRNTKQQSSQEVDPFATLGGAALGGGGGGKWSQGRSGSGGSGESNKW